MSVAKDAASYAENESTDRQRMLFMLLVIVGSYASAVSIVLAYMLIFGGKHELESLPDLVPPKKPRSDEIGWRHNPPRNNVAPGHVLHLGQSRRFGSVKVTPVKVTRGPIKFEHFSGQSGGGREPSPPVLKLWVKFENVSSDQTFAPLDAYLLFTRESVNLGQLIHANSFVAVEADRKQGKLASFIFDMPIHSEFNMVGQKLDREIGPGESVQTFIPSEAEGATLHGDLVFRFQFRKGYNPKSFRGVTTLVDVRFRSDEIKEDGTS